MNIAGKHDRIDSKARIGSVQLISPNRIGSPGSIRLLWPNQLRISVRCGFHSLSDPRTDHACNQV